MNICIGGPWHGSMLLAQGRFEKFFKVKDSHSKTVTTYVKRKVKVEKTVYIFWVSDNIRDLEACELIKKYLSGNFVFID